MANLTDAASLLQTSVVYDERTKRYHDMSRNYKMVSATDIASRIGSPTRDGVSSRDTKYVSQETFEAFQRDVFSYISRTASFAREAIIELQRSLDSERKDTQTLESEEFKAAEERRERVKDGDGIMQRIGRAAGAGIRSATGMSPLGMLATGGTLAAITALSGLSDEDITRIAKPIDDFIKMVEDISNKISEYSNLITAVGAGLLGLAAASMAGRLMTPQKADGKPGRQQAPSGQKPAGGGGAAKGGGAPSSGGAAKGGGAPSGGGGGARPPSAPSSVPQIGDVPQIPGQPPRPSAASPTAPAGTPDRAPPATGAGTPGAPERNRPPRRMVRLAGPIAYLLDVIITANAMRETVNQFNQGEISEQEYKETMIEHLGAGIGGTGGAALGGVLGTLLGGPVGAFIGSVAGASLGRRYGPDVAQTLFRAYLSPESPENEQEQLALGNNLGTELSDRLNQLRQESRERTEATQTTVASIEEAVTQGRITEEQAQQLRNQERAFQPTSPEQLSENVRRIEAATQEAMTSGIDPSRLQFTLGQDNLVNARVTVLPPIVQEVRQPQPEQRVEPGEPMSPTGIQTRNSDDSVGNANDHTRSSTAGSNTRSNARRNFGNRANMAQ